jgi:hypothetical protein
MIDSDKLESLEEIQLAIHALEWERADRAAALLEDLDEADIRLAAELLGIGHRALKAWARLATVTVRPPDQAPWVAAHEVGVYAGEAY